ncbi:hypothetical protein EJ08DRAFT_693177 [Tothia fuscella]|uniref:F-box domain-containing protein n=1 Tax=Tothia fuscella TaxID=1048955 RepID=A0A9P4NZW0_9PEZI|nr:hypothetical protein EJ08DRAFT_693177 [Tothia fuscella]
MSSSDMTSSPPIAEDSFSGLNIMDPSTAQAQSPTLPQVNSTFPELPDEIWQQIIKDIGPSYSYFQWMSLRNVCTAFRNMIDGYYARKYLDKMTVKYRHHNNVRKPHPGFPKQMLDINTTVEVTFRFSRLSEDGISAIFIQEPLRVKRDAGTTCRSLSVLGVPDLELEQR